MNITIYQNATPQPIPDRCVLPMVHGIPIIIINFTLVFVGTFGNFLIIFAVLNTPKLRHRVSNFLLLSLAAADLFVTMLAQPLHATSVTFTTFRHYCVPEIDFAYDIAGNFSVFCSLFHLASISIDRALVVAKPHQHHGIMTSYGLKLLLCICWGSAITFTPFRVRFSSASMMSIGLVVFNFVIIIISYAVILNQITRTKVISNDPAASASSSASRDARMERRVAGTIAIIILFFSICWFPLLGFYISAGNAVLRELGGVTYMWIRTLVLSNSSMNFIVYSCRIEHFRVAYLRIINQILQKPREIFGFSKFNTSGAGLSHASKSDNDMDLRSRLAESKGNNNAERMASCVLEDDDNCSAMSTPAEIHVSLEEKKDAKMGAGLQRVKSHSISSCSTARQKYSGEPESLTLDRRQTNKNRLSRNYNKFSL